MESKSDPLLVHGALLSSPTVIPSSFLSSEVKLVLSLRYTQSPEAPPSLESIPSPRMTQSNRLGPVIGLLSQICLFGGCLFRT